MGLKIFVCSSTNYVEKWCQEPFLGSKFLVVEERTFRFVLRVTDIQGADSLLASAGVISKP